VPKRNSKNIKFAPLNFHFVKAYPFRAPRNVEIIRAGIAILSELKKYGFKKTSLVPSPLPAHAIFHDSKLILFGKLKRLPSLISFIVFNEVTIITYKGVI
jgi:hypothetical protein